MPFEFKVPEVGESITEVYVGDWYKSEGDYVEQDEEIVELESEKATFDAPAPVAGTLVKILKESGDSAEVGEIIAHIDESGKPDGQGKKTKKKAKASKQKEQQEAEPEAEEVDEEVEAEAEDAPRVMPAARRLLKEHGLQAAEVEATGPGGRLLKEDVLQHVGKEEEQESDGRKQRELPRTPETDREEQVVRMSPLRRRIAERLVESQQTTAVLTTFNEIDMSEVMSLRKKVQEQFRERHGVKLGIMSFFVKASIDALKSFPGVNAMIRERDIVYRNYYDIGVAIGGGKGLVVPVLRNAERMSFAEIEQAIEDFVQRAQNDDLKPRDLRGGTFTISNGGVYGSLLSTPIINPPQSGVLGMHGIQDRPVVRGGEIVIRPMMYVALSYDHRIVDGREAVTFLRRIKDAVEEPARMLVEI